MSKFRIVHEPHKILRRPTESVPADAIGSEKTTRLISAMRETLRATPDGVGLAAPQLGVSLRIFIVSEEAAHISEQGVVSGQQEQKRWEYFAFINPVLKKRSREKVTLTEGCLSVPRRYGIVPRSEKVLLEWRDEEGRKQRRGFTRFMARVIQHELDHLDGMLITDRAKRIIKVNREQ